MKRLKNALKITAIIPLLVFSLICCNNRLGNKTHTALVLEKMTGKTIAGDTANFVESDVVIVIGTQTTVEADVAEATLRAKLIEPLPPELGSSYKNNVMLTRYAVTYTPANPGDGVPASFEGSLSALIEVDSSVDITFVIVRDTAKLVAPLVGLIGTTNSIPAVARVTFYGNDLANNPVQVSGDITIYFADYPN